MFARIVDGVALAADLRAELAQRVAAHRSAGGRAPRLAVLLASDDEADRTFAAHKRRDGAEVGIETDLVLMPGTASRDAMLAEVDRLNADPDVSGILVQTPLPDGIDPRELARRVAPTKDIDGLHPVNRGLLLAGRPRFMPATPAAILELLRRSGVETAGARVVVAGRSSELALPLALLLSEKAGANATVTVTDVDAAQFTEVARSADILVAAMNRPRAITAGVLRPGATVVDAGLNVLPPAGPSGRYRVVGDVDPGVREVAGMLVPTPGGVGPVTIAMLLANTLAAASSAG